MLRASSVRIDAPRIIRAENEYYPQRNRLQGIAPLEAFLYQYLTKFLVVLNSFA